MKFETYKPRQGKYTRLYSAFGVAVIIGLGCFQLYKKLLSAEWGFSPKTTLWVATMGPVGLFVILSGLVFLLTNKAFIADFLIAAESEIKKVSWSSRKEITVSTFIVIIVVVVMGVLLGATDMVFQLFFSWLL